MPDETRTRPAGLDPAYRTGEHACCRRPEEAPVRGPLAPVETPPEVGASVLDIAVGRLAEYRGTGDGRWRLRSFLGTDEWEARPEDVRRTEEVHAPGGGTATPEAHAECEECDAWWWAEQLAFDEGGLSEAVDCRLYLGRHQNAAHATASRTT
ncbi:hypothetical protein ACIBBB_24570 [Streptomyces sp. NPDC051217]|uniref:hypothetical protein n=1 Tax=Streptomyces sp. NPDC051217 TaxID=3365644 RepID=UPI003789568E